jgi:hypothetical protein
MVMEIGRGYGGGEEVVRCFDRDHLIDFQYDESNNRVDKHTWMPT